MTDNMPLDQSASQASYLPGLIRGIPSTPADGPRAGYAKVNPYTSLMSPDEPLLPSFDETFNSPRHSWASASTITSKSESQPANAHLNSPPISPFTRIFTRPADLAPTNGVKDPILYPPPSATMGHQLPSSPTNVSDDKRKEAAITIHGVDSEEQAEINEHMAETRMAHPSMGYSLPTEDNYVHFVSFLQTLSFRECMMPAFSKMGPSAWLKRERKQLKEDAKARRAHAAAVQVPSARRRQAPVAPAPIRRVSASSSYNHTAHRSPVPLAPASSPPNSTITARMAPFISSAVGPRNATKIEKRAPISRPARAPQSKAIPARRRSSTPPPGARKRQGNASKPVKEDRDYMSIPDYTPPISSLDELLKKDIKLKVKWDANKDKDKDFSDHPQRDELHKTELAIATQLRLDPAAYLTCKRRIFHMRLQLYHESEGKKPFRITNAQQACKIDVNKASQLHHAFSGVGWFDDKWIKHFPRPEPLPN